MYSQGHCVFIAIIKAAFPPHFANGCHGPVFIYFIFFVTKDTLDCDKMKWSSTSVDVTSSTQTTERGAACDVASHCSTQHLSFVTHQEVTFIHTSWTKKKTNQFSANRRLPCDANVQFAAPSGTVQLHVSTDEGCCLRGCLTSSPVVCRWCGRVAASSSSCWPRSLKTGWSSVITTGLTKDPISTTSTRYVS